MGKLSLDMTIQETIITMSQGNPGALVAITEMIRANVGQDVVIALIWLDEWGIYGSEIWVLYKDCCQQDPVKTYYAIRSVQLGIMMVETLKTHISQSIPISDEPIKRAKERLGVNV